MPYEAEQKLPRTRRTHSVAAISRQRYAKSSADLRSGKRNAAETFPAEIRNTVATRVGL